MLHPAIECCSEKREDPFRHSFVLEAQICRIGWSAVTDPRIVAAGRFDNAHHFS
jgi:hypothetical protein